MCVIVWKPREVPVDMEVLKECWDKNRDGAGLMYSEGGKLTVAKGFMKWRVFRRYIKRKGLDNLAALPVAFHFRIATHGSVKAINTHPFEVSDELAMMHNGVIRKVDKYIPKESDVSDSQMFAERFVKDAFSVINISSLAKGQPINDLFAEYIGTSKLLFMDAQGDVAIVNETGGTWAKTGLGEGMWFSNMNWKPYTGSTSFQGNTREVTYWERGDKVVKKYDIKTGKCMSTSRTPVGSVVTSTTFSQPHRSHTPPLRHKPLPPVIDRWERDNEEMWYCYECHESFSLGEAARTYWTNGLNERIVDCPSCGDSSTVPEDDLYDASFGNDGLAYDDEDVDPADIYKCYTCNASFDDGHIKTKWTMSDKTGDLRLMCPDCESLNTYEPSEQNMVDKFGLDYFVSPDLIKGGADA